MMSSDLTERFEALRAAYLQGCPDDFLLFAKGLYIPAARGGARLFGSCIQPFQLACFESLAPSLHALRDGGMPPKRRFWIERTKKSGKDSDLAVCLLWLMAFPKRPLKCQVVACHALQAGIVADRATELLHYNPWLKDRVEIIQRIIRNLQMHREVWTKIEASDMRGGAHGQTPDLLILNELTHSLTVWRSMEDHMHDADGVPQGVVIVSTNAGIKGSKAELWKRNAVANQDRWTLHPWNELSPWVDPKDVEDARRRDPVGSEFARLWEGKWISGTGDAVSQAVIDRCFRLDGPLEKPEPGWLYLEALDMGETHDHSGATIVGVNAEQQRIKVARIKGWVPSVPNDKGVLEIDADDVERECLRWAREFGVVWFGYDPAAGGRFIAQRLRKRGIPMADYTFASAVNQTAMATSFVQVMNDGKLECYDDEEGRLRRDFGKFNIEPKPPSGYRLRAVSDEYGHADVGTALVICLPKAIELMGGFAAFGDGKIVADGSELLSEKEVDEMPADLRDIYDSYGPPDDVVSRRENWIHGDRELF